MSTCSAIWSSLCTLELANQFTSTSVEPAKAHHTLDFGNTQKRHQKLASALAHIGETLSDAKNVTACSVEMMNPEDERNYSILIRMAQNEKVVQRKEIERFQSLVDGLVQQVSEDESDWSTKEVRCEASHLIVQDFLLPFVLERCQDKISHILYGPYSKPFRDWYADIVKTNTLEGVPDDSHEMVLKSLKIINDCLGEAVPKPRNAEDLDDDMICSIIASSIVAPRLSNTHEHSWTTYDAKVAHDKVADDVLESNTEDLSRQVEGGMHINREDPEYLDDLESLDPVEMKKSSIYRFLRKLERYYVSCRVVTSELVSLVRSGFELNVKVEPVPIQTIISTPSTENEYPSFEDYFTHRTCAYQNKLDPKKVGSLRDSWPQRWQSQNLFLHAEMQMAMFYALNPHLNPVRNFIGVSKGCCWCCDFVLKSLQNDSEGLDKQYNEDVAGPPIFFSVQETHNRKDTAWVFPDPSKHFIRQPDVLCQESFDKICHRFRLVREDLERALVREVNGILRKLQTPSDSSGMDDEWDSDDLAIMVQVFLAKRRKGNLKQQDD